MVARIVTLSSLQVDAKKHTDWESDMEELRNKVLQDSLSFFPKRNIEGSQGALDFDKGPWIFHFAEN